MHSDAVITDPNVKVRKASDIGADEQSKPNKRAIAEGRDKPKSAGKQVTEAGENVDFPMTPENQARLDTIAETMKDRPKVRKDPRPPTNPTSDKQAQQDIYRAAKREKGDATTTLVAGKRSTSRKQELEYDPNSLGIPAIETGQIIPAKKPRFKKIKGVSEELTATLNNMDDNQYRDCLLYTSDAADE